MLRFFALSDDVDFGDAVMSEKDKRLGRDFFAGNSDGNRRRAGDGRRAADAAKGLLGGDRFMLGENGVPYAA